MESNENILGSEKIGKLIRKFSVPCIISLLVNSLYNIVDQIYIGWGVGYLGNGATNIVFPLTMVCLAFALMFGDGASAYLSLKLGERKKEDATKGVANGIIISIIMSIILGVATLIFLPQLLNLFGCTDALRTYALQYGYVIAIGLPLMMVGTTLNSIIRADGSPKYAMISMIAGALLNVILDPLFIFVFKMGVEGAAIATVISQLLTLVINLLYIKKFKTITLNKQNFQLKLAIVKRVCLLGVSSFITQMSIVLVIAAENNLLVKYGNSSKFGSEIPITVLGIVMKISQILNSIIIGIAAGAQPIFGYNYGAGKMERVKKALKIVLGLCMGVSTFAFILFQTIPDKLISIFGSGDSNYMEFACLSFRIYLMLCIANGLQISAGIFFQAIGKSAKSAFLSLSRQILFLIPVMIIAGNMFGIMGVLYAGPIADGMAFIIAGSLLIIQVKKLNKATNKNEDIQENITDTNTSTNFHTVITIAREYGSGGRYVGKLIADSLGIKLYDKEFILKVAKETGLSEEYIEQNEQKKESIINFDNDYYIGPSNTDELFIKEAEIIRELAQKESCVIVGRCANFILKGEPNVTNIFIYSDLENKMKRAIEIYGLDASKAKKEIEKIDKLRANHYQYYTEENWKDASNYDICINSDWLGVEKTAAIICNMVQKDLEQKKQCV